MASISSFFFHLSIILPAHCACMSLTGQLRSLLVCHYHGAGRCPWPDAGPRPCLCPSFRRCLPACLRASRPSPFYSVPSPFPFRVFIITSLAPSLYPRLGSRICPHPHPEPEPHGRGRRRGAVALLLALRWFAPLANAQLISILSIRAMDSTLF